MLQKAISPPDERQGKGKDDCNRLGGIMVTIKEAIPIYYLKKWAKRYGIAEKDAKEAMDLLTKLTFETDYDENAIEVFVIGLYQTIPVETIFDKFEKAKDSKDAGKLVKFTRY